MRTLGDAGVDERKRKLRKSVGSGGYLYSASQKREFQSTVAAAGESATRRGQVRPCGKQLLIWQTPQLRLPLLKVGDAHLLRTRSSSLHHTSIHTQRSTTRSRLPRHSQPIFKTKLTKSIHQNDWRQVRRQGQRCQVERSIVSPLLQRHRMLHLNPSPLMRFSHPKQRVFHPQSPSAQTDIIFSIVAHPRPVSHSQSVVSTDSSARATTLSVLVPVRRTFSSNPPDRII